MATQLKEKLMDETQSVLDLFFCLYCGVSVHYKWHQLVASLRKIKSLEKPAWEKPIYDHAKCLQLLSLLDSINILPNECWILPLMLGDR